MRPLQIGKMESVYSDGVFILKTRKPGSDVPLSAEFHRFLDAEKRGVPVPRVIAFGKERWWDWRRENYLLLEAIVGGEPLSQVWLDPASGVVKSLATFVADLLQKGGAPENFSPEDVVVRLEKSGWQFYLTRVSSDGDRPAGLAHFVLDLMRLNPRAEERVMRFLLAAVKSKKEFRSIQEKALCEYREKILPELDRLPSAIPKAQRLVRRGIPIRLDFARPEGYTGADAFIPKDKRARIGFLSETAIAIRTAHWHGIRVNRVSLKNLILRLDPALGVQIFFIDPEEFNEKEKISFEERVEDLKACLRASRAGILRWRRTDRLRFLKFYLGPWYSRNFLLPRYYRALSS